MGEIAIEEHMEKFPGTMDGGWEDEVRNEESIEPIQVIWNFLQ